MRAGRIFRVLAVVTSASLILGAFVAAPADAKKKRKKKKPAACATYAPAPPESNASTAADAPKEEVVEVTAAATEEAPVTVEAEQGQGLWIYNSDLEQEPLVDGTKFFNFQVVGPNAGGLYIRQEWSSPSIEDLDLYAYDASGTELDVSGAFNAAPLPGDTGGNGFEQISGLAVAECMGVTAESRTYATDGETVTMKVWLGEPTAE